jgi:hypothetical protein
MRLTPTFFAVTLLVLVGATAYSQTGDVGPIRSSAAYSEVLLRKTQLQADLEAFLADYTEQNPKIIDIRTELADLNKSLEKIYAVKPSETAKLTQALGKLIVEHAALATDLARLQRSYSNENPLVKRAKRKVEIFDSAINEILK